MTPATSETHESPTSRDVLEQLTAVAERDVFPSVEAQAANLFRLVPSLLQIDFRELEIARATPSSLFQVHAIFTQIEMQGRLIIAEADHLIAVVSSHLATLASSAEVPARMVGIGRSWLQQADRLNEMIATAQRLADQPQWQGKASEAHLAVLPRQIEAMQQLRDLAETAAESVLLVGAIQNNIFDACALIFAEASEQVVGHVSAAPTAFFSHAASVVSLLVRVDALLAQWISGEGTWQPSADQIAAGLTKTSGAGFSWPKAVSQPGGGQESNSGADSEGGWKTTITEEGIKVQVPAARVEAAPDEGKGAEKPTDPADKDPADKADKSDKSGEEPDNKGKGQDRGAGDNDGESAKVTGKPGEEPPAGEPPVGELGSPVPPETPGDGLPEGDPEGSGVGDPAVPETPVDGDALADGEAPVDGEPRVDPDAVVTEDPAAPEAKGEGRPAAPEEPVVDSGSEETGVAGGAGEIGDPGDEGESGFEAVTPEDAAEALGLDGEENPGADPFVAGGDTDAEAPVDGEAAKNAPIDGGDAPAEPVEDPGAAGSEQDAPVDGSEQVPPTDDTAPDQPADGLDPAQAADTVVPAAPEQPGADNPSAGAPEAVGDPVQPAAPAQPAPAQPVSPAQPAAPVQPGPPPAQAPAQPVQGTEQPAAPVAGPVDPVVEPVEPVAEAPIQDPVEESLAPVEVPEPGLDDAAARRSADIDRGASAWDRLAAAR